MKNQKKYEKHQQQSKITGNYHGKKIWKITAIAVVVLFAVIILGALIKANYIRSSFVKPTQAQINYATKIATEKLQSMGGNASAFHIQAGGRMRRLHDDGAARTTMQVSFYNNSTTHTYLIDVNSGEILLHSQTDTYIVFGGYKKKHYNNDREFFEHDKIK